MHVIQIERARFGGACSSGVLYPAYDLPERPQKEGLHLSARVAQFEIRKDANDLKCARVVCSIEPEVLPQRILVGERIVCKSLID